MKTTISITYVQACLLQEIVVAAQAIAKKYGETLPHQEAKEFMQWMTEMGPVPQKCSYENTEQAMGRLDRSGSPGPSYEEETSPEEDAARSKRLQEQSATERLQRRLEERRQRTGKKGDPQ